MRRVPPTYSSVTAALQGIVGRASAESTAAALGFGPPTIADIAGGLADNLRGVADAFAQMFGDSLRGFWCFEPQIKGIFGRWSARTSRATPTRSLVATPRKGPSLFNHLELNGVIAVIVPERELDVPVRALKALR